MIIPKHKEFTQEEFLAIKKIVNEFGCDVIPIPGETMTVYAIKGDERNELMINRIEGLPFVERVSLIQSPYKLMDRKSELAKNKFRIAGKVPGEELIVIAGHCTIDPKNPSLFYESAHAIKEAGADVLRGGVWKPRTSPHSYQGDGKALEILLEARERFKIPIITEVMDDEQLEIAISAKVDMIQIGARNALNYSLLKKVGELTQHTRTPVLLKRGIHMAPVDEFISAAEYIVLHGNPNVVLCPRGTQPNIVGYRNYPDESITPLLKQKTWAPVIVDPSHSVGKSDYVPHAALAAISYGADGLIIETHIKAQLGIGDDPKQSIHPFTLAHIIEDAKNIFYNIKKYQRHYIEEYQNV
ncbi:MAG: 3-deoxy-D-arabino-heptulosonate 7-phosphate synthase [Leptospiraceae bacterium]|nr:3-deoxy-D-arabino-heptulosonate 7-phosphate synthase [Leptospiraceae bacterium]MDW7976139.1 3-deoxy-D-arabino-heptulosonate 7-phosphate synthase [Leptospiraceae bacterium]